MKKIKETRVVNGVETEVEVEVEDTGEAAGAGPKWGPNDKHTILNKPLKPAALRALLTQWRATKVAAE